MKKLLLCTLTLLLLCAGALAAQETQREGDFVYAVREDGTAEIVAYWNRESFREFAYPAELGGRPVTRIALDPMKGKPYAESVTIPDSVVELGSCPLSGVNLNEIIVSPDHPVFAVEGDMLIRKADRCLVAYAAGHAKGTVEIPADVADVADGVFAFCQNAAFAVPENHQTLTVIDGALYSKADHRLIAYPCAADVPSVSVAAGTEVIGDYAFSGCYGLTEITLPDSVTSIGDNAFYYCRGLTSITIPDGVTSIGDGAFTLCSGLTSITIPDSVTSIEDDTFSGCSGLTSITIPNSVTSIGERAFSGCSGLTSITLPDSVTSIRERAFSGCSSLTEFVVSPEQMYFAVIDGVLYRKADRCLVAYPPAKAKQNELVGVESIEASESTRDKASASFEISQGIERIGDSAFADCSGLTSITIPDSVTSIGDWAFYGCRGLTSITIPNSVTSIGDWAFYGCRGLTSITLPDSVTSIGDGAFNGCDNLSVTVVRGSDAAAYVREQGIPYTYTDAMDWLTGPGGGN